MPAKASHPAGALTQSGMGPLRRFVQMSLDLFGFAAAGPAGLATQAPPAARVSEGQPPVKRSRPLRPSVGNVEQASLQHPSASREIQLEGRRVAYEFKRGRRRTIGMQVGVQGLEVRAPRWVGQTEVDQALREKSAWILRKLDEARELGERQRLNRIEWCDGASIPYLGEPLIVVLDPRHGFAGAGAALNMDLATLPGVARACLHVGLRHDASGAQVRDAVQAWLMRQARAHFEQRLAHFGQQLCVQYKRLSLSSASTRWGSAGADGSIRLNWRLIHLRADLIDYVVAHELSHLRVMDHSARFWRTVESVLPEYPRLRAELREDALPLW